MARVHLKAHCSFFGKDYKPGSHNLPDSIVKEWFFKALVKSGKAELIDAKASKMMAESAPPATASDKRPSDAVASETDTSDDEIIEDDSEEPVGDFLDGEEKSEDSDDAEEKSKTKKKKKKSSKR